MTAQLQDTDQDAFEAEKALEQDYFDTARQAYDKHQADVGSSTVSGNVHERSSQRAALLNRKTLEPSEAVATARMDLEDGETIYLGSVAIRDEKYDLLVVPWQSQEAGVKYFVLGAFASAFFLYGIALVYGGTGSTNLVDISSFLATSVLANGGLVLAGMALLLVGFAFKVALVPFHFWTPDVYQGAPSPSVAWMASGVKVAGFAGLMRVFYLAFSTYRLDWQPIIFVLAAVTLVAGSVLAVVQTDVRRMLAYSSISHAGFVLVGVQAASEQGVQAALFYLAAYTFMVAGSFGVVTVVSRKGDIGHSLDDYRGLSKDRPLLALIFALFLFAQAGVPFTSGFFAKFYVITAAVDAGSTWLAAIAMLASVIAAFLYLRITVSMYMEVDEGAEREARRIPIPFSAGLALGVALLVTLVVGVFPSLLADPAGDATPALVATSAADPAAEGTPILP